MTQQECNVCGTMCVPYLEMEPGERSVEHGRIVTHIYGYVECHMCWLKRFTCMDCKWNTKVLNEYYALDDKLWLSVVPDGQGMLCIKCLEKRVGRRLTPTDFRPGVPINLECDDWPKSKRLRNRLGFDEPDPDNVVE